MVRARLVLVLGLSLVVAAASTVTIRLAGHSALGCPGSSISPLVNCRAVITSAGGHVLGLPLGAWALGWLALFWTTVFARRLIVGRVFAALAFVGIAYAVGTELQVGHLCAWCTLDQSAIAALAVWRIVGGEGAFHGPRRTP